MNIDGLSEETLMKFIDRGYIHEFSDIYHLDRYEDEIVNAKGFGRKSYDNLIEAIEKSRNTTLVRLIYSMGIPNIGLSNAKMICRHFDNDLNRILSADAEELTGIEGVGEVIAMSVVSFFSSKKNREKFDRLVKEIYIEEETKSDEPMIFNDMVFVVTGSVNIFTNRNEVKAVVEKYGGKVTGSVTSKTNYLINNDIASSSSKNKKAKELGVPIITEEEFIKMLPDNLRE